IPALGTQLLLSVSQLAQLNHRRRVAQRRDLPSQNGPKAERHKEWWNCASHPILDSDRCRFRARHRSLSKSRQDPTGGDVYGDGPPHHDRHIEGDPEDRVCESAAADLKKQVLGLRSGIEEEEAEDHADEARLGELEALPEGMSCGPARVHSALP